MPSIDLSKLIVAGQSPAAAAIIIAPTIVPETQTAPTPALTARDLALNLLQKILSESSQETTNAIELLSKLLPNLSAIDLTPDFEKLVDLLVHGNDESLLLQLIKDATPSDQEPATRDVSVLRKRLENLIKSELKNELVGQLLELLNSPDVSADTPSTTKLENLKQLLNPNDSSVISQKTLIPKTPIATESSTITTTSAIPIQLKDVADTLELIEQISDPQVKQLATTIVARSLLKLIASTTTIENSSYDPQAQLFELTLSRLQANSIQAKQAHNLSARAELVEFLFPKIANSESVEMANAFKLVLSAAPFAVPPQLNEALTKLIDRSSAPLLDLVRQVQIVEAELTKETPNLPATMIRALRQQLHLVLEHALELNSVSDPKNLLAQLQNLEEYPAHNTTTRANQIVALAERLINEVEREKKQPLARLLEKMQRAGHAGLAEEASPDQRDKAALLLSVDRLMRGQELIRQLSPVLQALSEPSVFFFPSFLSGLFAQLEVIVHPPPPSEDEDQRKKKSKSQALRTIEFSTSFKRLGETDVKIQYGHKRLFISLSFSCATAAAMVQQRISQLEDGVRALGYTEVALCARVAELGKPILPSKVSKRFTA